MTPPLAPISVSVKAAVVRDGRILLLSYDDDSGFHYNLPGGKVREGECLRDAVRRKVAQETGLRVEPDRLLFAVEYVPHAWEGQFGNLQKVQFNFLATPLDHAEPRLCQPRDPHQVGIEWVPVSDLPNRYLLPRITSRLIDALDGHQHDALVDRW